MTDDRHAKLSEQIDRLQQRQMEMVQQTAQGLELLKKELDSQEGWEAKLAEERQPLLNQIAALEQSVQQLALEKRQREGLLASLETQLQAITGQLKSASFDTPETAAPVAVFQTPPAAALPVPRKEKIERPKKERRPLRVKLPRLGSTRKVAVRAVSLALVVVVGYAGLHHFTGASAADLSAGGQVAGVSTDASATAKTGAGTQMPDYKESYVDLPFDQTKWERDTDSDFGISVEYPSNTSNLVHAIGGDNIWFLRKDGYLLKLTKIDTDQGLDDWIAANKQNYSDYGFSKTTFSNLPGWLAQSNPTNSVPSKQYFVQPQKNGAVYEVWIKDEPPTTDDGQRLARMVTSLQFIGSDGS